MAGYVGWMDLLRRIFGGCTCSIAEFADRDSMERAQREYDDSTFNGGPQRIRVDIQVRHRPSMQDCLFVR